MTPPARLALATMLAASAFAAGCSPATPAGPTARQLVELEHLRVVNEELRQELIDRDRQVLTLQELGGKRLGQLYAVQRITLGSGTGGANLDGKSGDDGVRVSLEPVDQYGSSLKAAGSVTIQVFDLAASEDQNLVSECSYDPNALGKQWSGGLFSSSYTLSCPWSKNLPAHAELTVRVVFTEYLTGKSFTAQKVVKVSLPPNPATQPASQPTTKPAGVPVTKPATKPA